MFNPSQTNAHLWRSPSPIGNKQTSKPSASFYMFLFSSRKPLVFFRPRHPTATPPVVPAPCPPLAVLLAQAPVPTPAPEEGPGAKRKSPTWGHVTIEFDV